MGYLFVNMQLPDAASLQRSDAIAKKIEHIILDHPEVKYVTNVTGYSLFTGAMSSNQGLMFVTLQNWDERDMTVKEFVQILNRELYGNIKGARAFAFGPSGYSGTG